MTPMKRAPAHKRRLTPDAVFRALRAPVAQCVYVLALGALALTILFMIAITPERYDLTVGDLAPKTITASKDVVDEVSTARQREAAARVVEPSYIFDDSVTTEVMVELSATLAQATAAQQYGQALLQQRVKEEPPRPDALAFSDAEMDYASTLLTKINLARYQLDTLLRTSDADMQDLIQNMTAAVENTLNTTIRDGYVNESIQYMQQIIGYKTDIDLLQNVVTPILRKVVKPNMVIDVDATAKLQEEARATVEPVIYKQGQNIVLSRERVTATQLEMLRSLGLLDNDSFDITIYLGAALLVALVTLVLVVLLRLLAPAILASPKKLLIVMLVLVATLAACILGQMVNAYLSPALLGVMMLTGMLGARCGVAACVSVAVLVSGLLAGGDSSYGAEMVNLMSTTLISGATAVFVIQRKPYRQQVLLSGAVAAVCNVAVMIGIGLMTNNSLYDVFLVSLWSAGSAVLASLLSIALDSILETAFRLATPSRLLELSNPNQPLLRRLLIEAPGTYHHSIIVANLAEAAAEAIGANALLARSAAYYHDIGKLKRPLYFKENQMGENPHERTNAYVSAAILTAHARDGLMMAQQNRLPTEIQDAIIEHHGDTPVMYFYHKALQQANGQAVDIADFRYDGRRPRTKESAIIMLADTVEAAVRSMPDPTPQGIEAFIERLVRGKLEDGQLSDSPLTLSDIDKVCAAFSTVLNGVFHERIEYPTTADAPPQPQRGRLPEPEESPVEARELRRVEGKEAARETPAEEGPQDSPAPERSEEATGESSAEDAPAPEAEEATAESSAEEAPVPEESGEATADADADEPAAPMESNEPPAPEADEKEPT